MASINNWCYGGGVKQLSRRWTSVNYGSPFPSLNKKRKSSLQRFISQFWLFIINVRYKLAILKTYQSFPLSKLDFNSQLRVYILYRGQKSELWDKKSQLHFYIFYSVAETASSQFTIKNWRLKNFARAIYLTLHINAYILSETTRDKSTLTYADNGI